MWTPADRALVGDFGAGQALTDDQFRLLEPLIPPAKPGGRPRSTDMRNLMDGLFYLVRTGCQWRHLPPPPAHMGRVAVNNPISISWHDLRWQCPNGVQVRARLRPGASRPEQTHIRPAHTAAAPRSRIRRIGLKRVRPFFQSGFKAMPEVGSPTWIRQNLIRVLPNANAAVAALRRPSSPRPRSRRRC